MHTINDLRFQFVFDTFQSVNYNLTKILIFDFLTHTHIQFLRNLMIFELEFKRLRTQTSSIVWYQESWFKTLCSRCKKIEISSIGIPSKYNWNVMDTGMHGVRMLFEHSVLSLDVFGLDWPFCLGDSLRQREGVDFIIQRICNKFFFALKTTRNWRISRQNNGECHDCNNIQGKGNGEEVI